METVKRMNRDSSQLAQIQCFLLDMDGTFYLGDRLLPGAMDFIELLRERGIPFLFLTNNSSKSQLEYVEKLARFGLELPPEQVFTSGEATARFVLKRNLGRRVFLVGTPALEQEFCRHGFELVDTAPDVSVLGFDTTLTYKKLWKLCDFCREGVPYIATHPDLNCPTETGFMPDIGAMIECVATSTGRRPDVIVGKPYAPMVEALEAKLHIPREHLAMVGDRLYTDIAMGRTGLRTVLVFSGETSPEDLRNSEFVPDWAMAHLGELAETLRHALGGQSSAS